MPEYVQKALSSPYRGVLPKGQYASVKLDGHNFLWDGGISIGLSIYEVPYANTAFKATRVNGLKATGLWSSHGNPIYYPRDFIRRFQLPQGRLLSGELWAGPGTFQSISSALGKFEPDPEEWSNIRPMTFDTPSSRFFDHRKIVIHGTRAGRKVKDEFEIKKGALQWAKDRGLSSKDLDYLPFSRRLLVIKTLVPEEVQVEQKFDLPEADLNLWFQEVCAAGGEGLILKAPHNLWTPDRSSTILKLKTTDFLTAMVVGWEPGKLGGTWEGKMGSVIVKEVLTKDPLTLGPEFAVSGFNSAERELGPDGPIHFPKGKLIGVAYRRRSDLGIPVELRYQRDFNVYGDLQL